MGKFILKWFINFISLLIVLYTVSGIKTANIQTNIIASLVLGLINIFIRPILLALTLPINILSLGISTLFLNGFIFYFAAKFIKGFIITDFWAAFWGALIFSIVRALLNSLINDDDK